MKKGVGAIVLCTLNSFTIFNKRGILISILLFLLCCGVTKAQSADIQSDDISWHVNGLTDLNTNSTQAYQCKFVTFGTQNIDWIQGNGDFVLHFSVTGTTGNWSNPTEDGSIIFSINGEGLSGNLTITKSTEGVSAILHLNGGTQEINHSYIVQSYEKI